MERLILAFGLVLAGCSSPAGGPNDMSVLPDLAGTPPSCTEGTACTVGGQQALCHGGACSLCTDTDDDAACASAYGAGNICAGGSCRSGCHDDSTCAGQVCDNGSSTCRACAQDGDCSSNPAGTSCNTSTGLCGAAATCTDGTPCAGGICCGGVCNQVDSGQTACCGGGCPSGQACSAAFACYATANCSATAPSDKLYVDPSAPAGMSGVGSTQCPFNSLDNALNAIPKGLSSMKTFTVCTKGTFDSTNDKVWPRYIPAWVTLDGNYCNTANTTHTILKVPNGNSGIFFVGNGNGGIHGYDIIEKGTKSSAGIFVSNTGTANQININDVVINNFTHGIHATTRKGEKAGSVHITHDTDSSMNTTGLLVDVGAVADINVTAAVTTHAQFNNNDSYGIHVDDATLTVEGANFTGAMSNGNSRTVRADANGADGLYISSGKADVTLAYFSGTNNAYNGISVVGPAKLAVHHSVFLNNKKNGAHVWFNAGFPDISALNFGNATTSGNNAFNGNTYSGICVDNGVSGTMTASGNTYNNGDSCSTLVNTEYSCIANSDVAINSGGIKLGTGSGCTCAPVLCQ